MGTGIYSRLIMFYAQSTFFMATLRIRILGWIAYRITKKFYKYNVIRKMQTLSSHGLAIIALYPRAGILSSVTRLIDSLLMSNYSVLVVMNESKLSARWLETLASKPVEILARPNLGRDFGAYKIGFKYAEKNGYLSKVEHLLFANDSTLYGPQSIKFVKSMLKVDLPWHSMFVNYQKHLHAQSFFQVFSKEIFQRKKFYKFWHDYYPSEFRHHAINYGEVGLSSLCTGEGFAPVSFVDAKAILDDPKFKKFTLDETFGLCSSLGWNDAIEKSMNLETLKFIMKRQYLEVNITHHQGLLASRILKAPLKLDLFRTGQVTKEGIIETLGALGLSELEVSEVVSIMTLNGSHVSRKGLDRLWSVYGYV
jgi:hypothetical protein